MTSVSDYEKSDAEVLKIRKCFGYLYPTAFVYHYCQGLAGIKTRLKIRAEIIVSFMYKFRLSQKFHLL